MVGNEKLYPSGCISTLWKQEEIFQIKIDIEHEINCFRRYLDEYITNKFCVANYIISGHTYYENI